MAQSPYPPPPQMVSPMVYTVPAGQWSTGLFGCFEDCSSCKPYNDQLYINAGAAPGIIEYGSEIVNGCLTWCCSCVTFGRNVEIIDQGTTGCAQAGMLYYLLALVGCACLYTYTYRSKLRAQFGLTEDPCSDFLVHCCCSACAFCQEHRELKNRGLNPSQGWIANAQKWNHAGVAMVPPTFAPGMARN